MGYLPIFLDVGGRPCIVIGGGEFAEAKVSSLLEAGAIVTVISAEAGDQIKTRAAAGQIRYLARDCDYGDLRGNVLAYVATSKGEVVSRAMSEARELGIPLSVVDDLQSSTFLSPAILRRGDLQIAISTSGSSPAVARMIRERLEGQIGPQYGFILALMRIARQFLRIHEPEQSVRADKLKSLAAALLESVDTLDQSRIDQLLRLHLNADTAELGLDLQYGLLADNAAPDGALTKIPG
jgi:siroheme synthase-like protein